MNYVIMFVQKKGGNIIDSTEFSLLFFDGAVEYNLSEPFERQSSKFYDFINSL